MKVAYTAPLRDYSGYGEASRHAAIALETAGIDVVGELVSYQSETSDLGSLAPLVDRMVARKDDYEVQIIHTTPDEYSRLMVDGKYHIGHFFWETDRVPDPFVEGLNLMDEIWTGSKANEEAMLRSGVKTPIFIFPQAIETDRKWPKGYNIPGFDDGYLFYSIFEWTDRKNPEALLQAYFEEFTANDKVGLLIKTYFRNFSGQHKQMIRNRVQKIRDKMGATNPPPVYLWLHLMDRHQMMRLHMTGDCFVSTHRGEGWGIPQVEAALSGHPVISTGYGGCHEYFTRDHDMLKLNYQMTNLRGMQHSPTWYTDQQKWAEVDRDDLKKKMRLVYKDQELGKAIGKTAQQTVKDDMNLRTVGNLMADRLKLIAGVSKQ